MPKHSKPLLLLGALCWFVPASASQVFVDSDELPGCPVARARVLAEAKAEAGTTTLIFVSRQDAFGEGPMFGPSRAFQP